MKQEATGFSLQPIPWHLHQPTSCWGLTDASIHGPPWGSTEV
jgi:hypothetical protein